jgi:hypothetical protein
VVPRPGRDTRLPAAWAAAVALALPPTTANSQLAFGTYLWDETAGKYVPGGLDVLTIQGGRVPEVTAFLTADLTRFGLPAHIRV